MRFSVGKKIGFGFAIIGFLILVVFSITLVTVKDAKQTLQVSIDANKVYTEVAQPTVDALGRLKDNILSVSTNVNNWVFNDTKDESSKKALISLIEKDVPNNLAQLDEITKLWDENSSEDLIIYEGIKADIDKLFADISEHILETLVDLESRLDPINAFIAQTALSDEVEPNVQRMLGTLEALLQRKNEDTAAQKNEMTSSFTETNDNFLLLIYIIVGALLVLFIGTLLIAFFTTRSITKPVHELKGILINLGKGIFPKNKINPSNDEIGEMSLAMNQLVEALRQTTTFANEVGKSNFDYPYTPLSDEDVLGHALIKMRDELAESERILEQKVIERTAEVVRQKEEINHQREKLEELYKDVTDSIRYAKRLQDSILPTDHYIEKSLPDSFVLFKPKDIVSGDFYWFSETKDKVLFSAVDCTGHGVPGAFMSLIGANALNQIVQNKVDEPAVILNELNRLSSEALNKSDEGRDKVRDGMDLALCAIDKKFTTLEYAGANNPLYIVRGEEIQEIKADKFAIASFEHGEMTYTNHTIELQKGDLVYIFSDGYADQFGGAKGKKFMYKQFRDLLLSIKDMDMRRQKEVLHEKIEQWKGSFEQVDDILVIGVRI
jgi:serine phosphatase RsbU (regulator of sigma subunit)/F0F1-type ATP synthase assembly protein I